jgi:hypothetical protein
MSVAYPSSSRGKVVPPALEPIAVQPLAVLDLDLELSDARPN